MAETPNPVIVLCRAGELDHRQCASKVVVEARLLAFAVQRRGDVEYGPDGLLEARVRDLVDAQARAGEIPWDELDAVEEAIERLRIHVELHRFPQLLNALFAAGCSREHGEADVALPQENVRRVRAKETGGAGRKDEFAHDVFFSF